MALRILSVFGLLLGATAVAGAMWLYVPDLPREELLSKYGTRDDQDLSVAGLRLRLRDTGPKSAPAVILLHGFGSSLDTFEAWAGALSARYRVIRYDLPGFGLTGADPLDDYSDQRGMAILAALMDRLGLTRASLIGNSMGGRLAWQFAATHPERVEKLVLISPDGFASPGFDYGKPPTIPLVFRALPYVLPMAMVRANLAPAYGDQAKLTDALVTRYRDMMLAPGVRRAIIDRTAQTILEDPRPLLRTITAPTLLLWGDRDGMIPRTNADDYLRDIPLATLVTLPGLGHVPHEEAPEISLPPVEAFLAK